MQMKKMNSKQLAYSKKKVSQARGRLYRTFFFTLLGIVAMVIMAAALSSSPINWDTIVTVLTGSGISWATMATIGNMAEISDKESSPNQIDMKVWLIAREQVDPDETFPTPNSDRELGTIPLLSGQVPHYFDAIPDTPDEIGTATKGEIITEFAKTFSFIVAGNREKHLDFIEEYAGKGFIIIYSIGEDGTKYVLGSYYKPMVLQTTDRKGGGKEGRYITFTFQNKHWRQPLLYVGSIATESPDTVAAGATTLPITSASQYQLSDHSADVTIAAVSGIGSEDIGRVVELLAPATDVHVPDVADNSVFILMDTGTWTAHPGSRILFKILGTGTMVEVPGTRVQTA
jgi:hypothetical protein